MGETILIGPSGFLGPAILKKYPKIIAVGRSKPPFYCKNKFIKIKDIHNLKKLDNIKIKKCNLFSWKFKSPQIKPSQVRCST